MARSAKTDTDKAVDAEIVGETVPADDLATEVEDIVATDDATSLPDDSTAPTDSVLIVESLQEPDQPESSGIEPSPNAGPSIEPLREAPPLAKTQRSGFLPLALGGAVAAALGFVAGWQFIGMRPDTTAEAVAAQAEKIAALEAQIANLPAPPAAPDLSPLEDGLAGLQSEIAPLAAQLAGLESRLTELERAPAADGTLSDTAIAAWEAELDTIRADIAAQQERTQALADEATARLDAAQSTVSEIEENATASATSVLQRAAVSRMLAAADSGAPFDAALGELTATGVAVPDVLTTTAAEGVPTIAALSESFPAVARAALATARAEGLADDGDGRVLSFLRSQFDVRSVTPREGDDPDAILSRAEAALREGRLSDSLAEVAALPEVVRADMTGWITQAESRVAVLAALQGLSETLPESSN